MVSYTAIPQRPQNKAWKTISINFYSAILKHNNNISLNRKSSSNSTKKNLYETSLYYGKAKQAPSSTTTEELIKNPPKSQMKESHQQIK